MAKLNFGLFCEYSLIATDNMPSFIGVFSDLIAKKPALKTFSFVVNVHPEEKRTHVLKISVKSPSGKEINKKEKELKPLAEDSNDFGFMWRLSINFDEEGKYKFDVFLDDDFLHSVPLGIKFEK